MNKENLYPYTMMAAELGRRIHANQLRRLRSVHPVKGVEIIADGRPMVNFCANDYLGLSFHPALMERSCDFVRQYGVGAGASRLISGNYDYYSPVEAKLARLKKTEAALILSSGFQANISVIPALANPDSLILSDSLNHNSLIQGCRLSRAKILVYRHNDMNHLSALLKQHADKGYSGVFVVTESVFSMDGDRVDMGSLVALCRQFGAFLMVDEAHATGVLGLQGMGLACGQSVDLVIGTFGKACGSFGAYLACSVKIRDFMINCCSGLIYSTALPPAVLGAIDAALDMIPSMNKERASLHQKADLLRKSLKEMGWDTGCSSTQIIPVVVGEESLALSLMDWLGQKGILAVAVRPPTVPRNASRIRLSLSALHSSSHLERLMTAMGEFCNRLPSSSANRPYGAVGA